MVGVKRRALRRALAIWTISRRRLRGKTDSSTQARAPMHDSVPVWNL